MIIETFVLGPLENNTYLLVCEKYRKALIIDPSFDALEKANKYLKSNSLLLDKILLTHFHWDHIAGIKSFQKVFLSPVYIHEKDAVLLQKPQKLLSLDLTVEGIKPDVLLVDNDKIALGDLEIRVIHTPGHTPGCVCYYLERQNTLFSGDTLFKGSFGRVDFVYSNSKEMIQSLKKLSFLKQNIKVYPGHGATTTIKNEAWIKDAEKFI
jgi:hydroxyacylglutathione hydrolase